MVQGERVKQAQDALQGLSDRELHEVLGLLVAHRPEAVLQAVDDLRRHQRTLAQLRAERPPGVTLF